MDQISAALRRAMPFQMVSNEMLGDIAKLAKWRSHARGDMLYERGDEADDVYIVSSGSVQHLLKAQADGAEIEKIMRDGDVFGWAAVLEGQRRRLAKTVCLAPRTTLGRCSTDAEKQLLSQSLS